MLLKGRSSLLVRLPASRAWDGDLGGCDLLKECLKNEPVREEREWNRDLEISQQRCGHSQV